MSSLGQTILVFALASVAVLGCQAPDTAGVSYEFASAWGSRGEQAGQFIEPVGIAIAGGEVFVSDAGNNRIQVFDLGGGFLRSFGSEGDSLGQLLRPMHLGIRGDTLLVSEYVNDRVQSFTFQGKALSYFGESGSGPLQFDAPTSATSDGQGRIYVADFYNQRVQVIGPDGQFLRQYGSTGVDGPAPGQFTYPTAVAVFPSGGFVVADAYNHRIQAFDEDGTFRWMLPEEENWADTTAGRFNVATSVAVGPGNDIYVADFYNHRIQVISESGEVKAVFGEKGSAPGQFDRPTDLAFDSEGNLYVVDFGNDRIQQFAPVR